MIYQNIWKTCIKWTETGESIVELILNFYSSVKAIGEIGRLNFTKVQLEKEVAELMDMLGHCKSVMKEKD